MIAALPATKALAGRRRHQRSSVGEANGAACCNGGGEGSGKGSGEVSSTNAREERSKPRGRASTRSGKVKSRKRGTAAQQARTSRRKHDWWVLAGRRWLAGWQNTGWLRLHERPPVTDQVVNAPGGAPPRARRTAKEDSRLLALHSQLGRKWTAIAAQAGEEFTARMVENRMKKLRPASE